MQYYEILKGLREDNELKQSDIAKILNCNQSAIAHYESGKRDMPINAIIKLCLFYRVSADYILGLPKGMYYRD